MSIDYYIYNFDAPLPSDEVLCREGYRSKPLGDVRSVKAQIEQHAPNVHWAADDPFYGSIPSGDGVVDLNISPEADGFVYCIGVHPTHGVQAEAVIQPLCAANGWYVHDPQMGAWIAPQALAKRNRP